MVRAIKVDHIRGPGGEHPGAVEFRRMPGRDNICGIAFRCPCGCGFQSYMPVHSPGAEPTGRPEWAFNGSEEAPTTTPSILQSGLPCKWHGYLTNGEFVPC